MFKVFKFSVPVSQDFIPQMKNKGNAVLNKSESTNLQEKHFVPLIIGSI